MKTTKKMKKYAVSFINFYDNDLKTKVVEVEGDWLDALEEAFPGYRENVEGMEFEEAKEQAFNQDWLFDVVEVN